MTHSKTSWNTGDPITAAKLNNDASQYEHASTDMAAGTLPLAATALTGTIDAARLPAPAASTKGGVALPASSTGKYYKDDGTWATPAGGGAGDVVGPASATDNAVVRFDETTGKLLQDSLVTVDNSGSVNIPSGQTYKVNGVSIQGSGSARTPASWIVVGAGANATRYNGSTGAAAETTTSAACINNAIAALTAGRTWKERIVLMGSFTTSASITLASYTILELDGKVKLSNDAHVKMVYGDEVSHVEICGGDWDGNLANDTHGGSECRGFCIYGSFGTHCDDIYIHDLAIHDLAYDNIACMYCDNVTIQNCHIYNAGDFARGEYYYGHGLGMYYSSNCVVDHCHIEDCASGGCYFYCEDDSTVQSVNNNQITHNLVERTYTSGISFGRRGAEDVTGYDLHEGNTVIDCGIDGYHPGINLGYDLTTKALHCVVNGNIVYCNSAYTTVNGISITADHCIVSNNVVHDIDGSLILVEGDHNIICGNNLHKSRDAASAGIYMIDASYNNVYGNTIHDVNAYGIAIMTVDGAGCIENWIHGNIIDTVDGDVVGVTRSTDLNTLIEDNYFRGTPLTVDNRGTGTILRRNKGYVTEASGTATITSGQALVNVTHGLSATPTKITATGSTADTNALYINTIGSSTFRVNAAGNVGGNRTIYWRAEV